MSKINKISIVIPNWNGAFLLKKNLPYVINAKNNSKNNIVEIIVADDASIDNSVEVLQKEFKNDVRLVKHRTNRRFAAAVNTGVRFAKGTHVCLLNTDVVPEIGFLEKLLDHLENKNVFGVTLHEIGYGPAEGIFDGYFKHNSGAENNKVRETFWISGGSGVFSKTLWKELKGMDENLYAPFYWEDVDLGYRAHKRGYSLLWEPSARVTHKHESINSTNFSKGYLSRVKERNELLFIWKNITSKSMSKKHRAALFRRIRSHPGYIKILIMALLKWGQVAPKRKKERDEASVSDEAVFAKFTNLK